MLRRISRTMLACSAVLGMALGAASPAAAAPNSKSSCAALSSQALAAAGAAGQARSDLAQSGSGAVGSLLKQLGACK